MLETDDVLIRNAAPSEAGAVLSLMCDAFGEYRRVLRPESSVFVETEGMIAAKLAGGGGFVAESYGKRVGCVIAELKDRGGYLGRLAVLPAARGRGVAQRLMRAGEDFLRSRGVGVVEINVRIVLTGNIALFHTLGYRETRRLAHPGWAEPTYLVMEKSLE